MEKRSKKGASHVEFVLSFVIFVVFLIFMYNGLEPIVKSAGSKQFVLGHLQLSLIENLTLSDFTIQTFTIEIDVGNITKPCVRVQEGNLFNLVDIEDNLTIKNDQGKILNYSLQARTHIFIGPIEEITKIIKVYSASDFTNKSPELINPNGEVTPAYCEHLGDDEYILRKVTTKEVIASTNVFDIMDWYDENYDKLNINLGVPSGSDWNFEFQTFEFINAEGDSEPFGPEEARTPPENTNIYVGEFPIQYIDDEATTKIGFIKVTVW